MARKTREEFKIDDNLNFARNVNAELGFDPEYQMIPKDRVHYSPYNEGLEMDNIDEYVESIREHGMIEPIVVYDCGDGTFEILSGHQRYHAWCEVLGHDSIRAVVRPYEKDPYKRFQAHTEANTMNRTLGISFWTSRIRMANKVLDENQFLGSKEERNRKICDMLNISISQLYRYQSFEKLIPELREFESKKWLSALTLYSAVSLTETQQRALADRINALHEQSVKNGEENFEITRDEYNRIVRDIKENRQPAEEKQKPKNSYAGGLEKKQESMLKALSKPKTKEDCESAVQMIDDLSEKLKTLRQQLVKKAEEI